MVYRCKNDKNWSMEYVSKGAFKLTGYSSIEILNNNKISFELLIFPEDRKKVRDAVNYALKKKKSFEIEYRIITKSGKIKWVWERGQAIYKQKNRVFALEGYIMDISDKINREQELNQKWLEYKGLVEHLPVGILLHVDGTIIFSNKEALKIGGVKKKEDLIGKKIFEFLKPTDILIAKERAERVKRGDNLQRQEYEILNFRNEKLLILANSSFVLYQGKEVIQISIQDITSQRKLQIERNTSNQLKKEIKIKEDTQKKLLETQRSLRQIIDSSLDVISTEDKEGNITEFNPAAEKLFGYKKEEILGKKSSILFYDQTSAKEKTRNNLFKKGYFQGEVINRKKNGEKFTSLLSASVLKDLKGNIVGTMGVSKDITQLKKQQLEIQQSEEKLRAQSAKLTSVFETSTHLVWTVNRKKELTYFNSNFSKIVFEQFGVLPVLNTRYIDFLSKSEAKLFSARWENKYKEVFLGKNLFFERSDQQKNGEEIVREIYLNPIKNSSGEIIEISGFSQDVTQRKKSEKQILEQSSKLKAIFDSGNLLIWSINKKGQLTSFNSNYSKAIQQIYGFLPEPGKNIRDNKSKVYKIYHQFWDKKYKEVFKGREQEFVMERKNLDGSISYAQFHLHPIYSEGKIEQLAGIGQDISQQKIAELKLIESEAKNKAILEAIPDQIFTLSTEGYFVDVKSREGSVAFIYSERLIGKNIDEVFPQQTTKELKLILSKVIKTRTPLSHEYEIESESGKKVFEIRFSALNERECMAILRDITEGKSAEQKIINSLREKEVLLKEIHHRVKNNLQVISSILNLQSNYVRDINTISILKECQSRIKSMAFIHELLYQNKDFNKIDFSEYVLVLAKNLIHSFGALDNRIKYKFEIDPVLLSLDTSIPCGLIVNELLTNALKYAFPNNKGGFIFVSLKRDSVGVKLTIKDNGVGLPPGLDYQNTESLGLQLVNTLVEQVSGSIEVFSSEDKGTAFSIVIKSENTEQNV